MEKQWRENKPKKYSMGNEEKKKPRMCEFLTIGCWSKTVLSKSPCSQNSAATIRATWRGRDGQRQRMLQGKNRQILREKD